MSQIETALLIESTRGVLPRHSRLGHLAMQASDVHTAEEWFAAGMNAEDPDDVLGCVIGLAWIALIRGDLREAQDLLERAQASGRSDAAYNLGLLAEAEGDSQLAQFWWDQSRKSAIRSVKAASEKALAGLMTSVGEYEFAENHGRQAALQGHAESIRNQVWNCVASYDMAGLHYNLMLGKRFGDAHCVAMYEVAIVDLIREASTEWIRPERLAQLAQHTDWRVRSAVRTNPSTPESVRHTLANDSDIRVHENDFRESRRYPALTNASPYQRMYDFREDLEIANMEIAVQVYPDNFILNAIWRDMRRRKRRRVS